MAVKGSVAQEREARPLRRCAECGEAAGSISAGTGRPLVLDRERQTAGEWRHINCRPTAGPEALEAMLERMGA
jgi:hypothetical protein